MVFRKIRNMMSSSSDDLNGDEYIEIDVGHEKKDRKILVKLFSLKNYDDINPILNALREGYTIAVIDIKVLKQKDSIELKRAISKVKKTIEALEGSIGGFGENVVIATPSFARISKEPEPKKEDKSSKFDY